MITFFTTLKPFIGENIIHQNNSLRSIKKLDNNNEIFVYGEVVGDSNIINELQIKQIVKVDLFENKLPLISSMFIDASLLASKSICCYINSDIIVTPDFLNTIQCIHNKINSNYLLCGQRSDFDIKEEILFEKDWLTHFFCKFESSMKLHPPTGSDFFVFPRGQYLDNDIPPLVVGRPGWDLWMIYNGIKQRNLKVIDISNSVKVYHQNHLQNYKPLEFYEKNTAQNLQYLPEKDGFNYILSSTSYILKDCKIIKRKLFGKGELFKQLIIDIKNAIKLALKFKIKLNIGSSGINIDKSWLSSDIDTLDVTRLDHWRNNLSYFKADNIMAEHVWEHLSEHEIKLANANCFKFLKKSGKLRLAVPDGYFPDKDYIEYVRPGGSGNGANDHKILFNYKILKNCLEEAGFKVNLLEYWDEYGKFHYQQWDIKDGNIRRSSRFDKRNEDGNLKYTSLIVDAIKD